MYIGILIAVLSICWFLFHKKSKSATIPSAAVARAAIVAERLVVKHQPIIAKYVVRVEHDLRNHYLAKDCFREIMLAEGYEKSAPSYGGRGDWESETPDKLKPLAARIKQIVEAAEKESSTKKEKIENVTVAALLSRNNEVVNRFCEIAERKVSTIDGYGDEKWELLKPEVALCIKKLEQRDSVAFSLVYRLEEALEETFRQYHQAVKPTEHLNNMTGVEFETYVARLLTKQGYVVQGTPTTGDQGADLIAQKNGKKIIVQVKRYAGRVGNKAVQEAISALAYYKADEAWVVTNSRFTFSAEQLAYKANVRLIDGRELSDSQLN